MAYLPYIVLFHHILCVILAIFSLKCILPIFLHQKAAKFSIQISPIMYFYFIFIIIWGTVSLINRSYSIVFWRPSGNVYDARILYWLGFFIFILGLVGIILEICLCIDRCASILFPMKYSTRYRIYHSYGTIAAVIIYLVGYLSLNHLLAVIPISNLTDCLFFGCLLNNLPTHNLTQTKFITMAFSVGGGIMLYILMKTKFSTNNSKNKQICKTILKIIASSTIFLSAPSCLSYLLYNVSM